MSGVSLCVCESLCVNVCEYKVSVYVLAFVCLYMCESGYAHVSVSSAAEPAPHRQPGTRSSHPPPVSTTLPEQGMQRLRSGVSPGIFLRVPCRVQTGRHWLYLFHLHIRFPPASSLFFPFPFPLSSLFPSPLPSLLPCFFSPSFHSFNLKSMFYTLCIYPLWICVSTCDMASTQKPESDLWELALSFHHVAPRNWTRVLRLGSKCLCHLSHLAGPALPSSSSIPPSPRALHKLGSCSGMMSQDPIQTFIFQ